MLQATVVAFKDNLFVSEKFSFKKMKKIKNKNIRRICFYKLYGFKLTRGARPCAAKLQLRELRGRRASTTSITQLTF